MDNDIIFAWATLNNDAPLTTIEALRLHKICLKDLREKEQGINS